MRIQDLKDPRMAKAARLAHIIEFDPLRNPFKEIQASEVQEHLAKMAKQLPLYFMSIGKGPHADSKTE